MVYLVFLESFRSQNHIPICQPPEREQDDCWLPKFLPSTRRILHCQEFRCVRKGGLGKASVIPALPEDMSVRLTDQWASLICKAVRSFSSGRHGTGMSLAIVFAHISGLYRVESAVLSPLRVLNLLNQEISSDWFGLHQLFGELCRRF